MPRQERAGAAEPERASRPDAWLVRGDCHSREERRVRTSCPRARLAESADKRPQVRTRRASRVELELR